MHLGEPLSPTAASERIEAMDVVRGFALLGILLMNIEAFVGPVLGAFTGLDPGLRGADRGADALVYILVQGKFYTLFSLLFGMGFALMMARAEATGRPFSGLYLRRTLGLLAIGLVHMVLIWSGDILTAYALIALVLLLCFRRTPLSRLPSWGVALYLVPSLLIGALGVLASLAQIEPGAAAKLNQDLAAQAAGTARALAAQRQAFGSGSYLDAVIQRWADLRMFIGYLMLLGWQVLGLFVLGSWFVRSGAIARPHEFPRLYARLRWVALPVGLLLMLGSYRLAPTHGFGRMDAVTGFAHGLGAVGGGLMCLGYLGWIVRGLQSPAWARKLRVLAPAGRMALTHYLVQSLVCTLIFYGYGLGYFEQLSRAWQVPFCLVLFALQVAVSHWWFARFRYGPMEWLWRAVTYWQRPPMWLPAMPVT